MSVCTRINVDLVLLDDELMIPFESAKKLFSNKFTKFTNLTNLTNENNSPTLLIEEDLTNKSVQDLKSLRNLSDYNSTTLKNTYKNTKEKLSTTTTNKRKKLESSEAIKIANSLLENLFEDNKKLLWYETNTYYGIAIKRYNSLVCYYTVESRKSKFLTVYIRIERIKDYLVKNESNRYELHLPDLGMYKVDRLTSTNLVAVCTQDSKMFYLLIKKLVKMLA